MLFICALNFSLSSILMPRMFTLRAVVIVEYLMLIGLINVSHMDGASNMT